jgi:hypothetical protein
VIVHFVDIGGIDEHHCLNFLFIILRNISPVISRFQVGFLLSNLNIVFLIKNKFADTRDNSCAKEAELQHILCGLILHTKSL